MKTKLLALIAGVLGALSAPAQAGQWILDGYDYQMKSLSDHQSYGSNHAQDYNIPGFSRRREAKEEQGFHRPGADGELFGFGGDLIMNKGEHDGGLVPPPYRYFAVMGYVTLTVTPVFRWEPNLIYDPDDENYYEEDYEGTHDPTDKPPKKLWYYETGRVLINRSFYMPYGNERYLYNEDAPYGGHHFSVKEINNGLGTPAVESQYTYGVGQRAFESHVKVKDTEGKTTVRGDTRSLKVEVETTAAALFSDNRDENYATSYGVTYIVDLINFGLMSRLKGDHDPTDLSTDLQGGGYSAASHADIAAGGFASENHEHEADVVMSVKARGGNWGQGTPLPDVPRRILPRLRIHNREGVKVAAQNTPQGGATDQGGRVLSDIVRSRDLKTYYIEGGTVDLSLGNANSNSNYILMGWGNIEWRMGEEGDKQWNTRFLLLGGDYSEWVWTKVKHHTGKPLLDHTMKLIVDRLQVRETNPQTGEVKTTLYTTDQSEAGQGEDGDEDEGGDPSFRVVYAPDLTVDVARFITLPGEMSDSGGGVYKGQFTVHKIEGVEIDKLNLSLEDQGVYRPVY